MIFFSAEILIMRKIKFFLILSATFTFFIFSCKTTPQLPEESVLIPEPQMLLSRKLLDPGQLTAIQLTKYFLSKNPSKDVNEILNMASDYISEANAEGINSDVAFAQMCLETGYLRFGNLVTPAMHNYCGLGAMDKDHPGEYFPSVLIGIRAHIQHLQAYATTEEIQLNNELVDPRYNWVHKTKYIETIEGLAGTWATDKLYAQKIEKILTEMETM